MSCATWRLANPYPTPERTTKATAHGRFGGLGGENVSQPSLEGLRIAPTGPAPIHSLVRSVTPKKKQKLVRGPKTCRLRRGPWGDLGGRSDAEFQRSQASTGQRLSALSALASQRAQPHRFILASRSLPASGQSKGLEPREM